MLEKQFLWDWPAAMTGDREDNNWRLAEQDNHFITALAAPCKKCCTQATSEFLCKQ